MKLGKCSREHVMRQPRFISPWAESDSAVYHCVSRVVDRRFVLGREEKDVFVSMMRQYEAFCGVKVLSYCIMSNHFHLMVEVPPKVKGEAVEMSDTDFLAKMKAMYSKVYYRDLEQMLVRFRSEGAAKAAAEFKAKYTCRMYDLSEFMKGLKQRFTQWFNGAHDRRGTLWEGRFKSVLVQNGYASRVMAAYIDLNPIRAGMVSMPEDYKWCSYGEAMRSKGHQKARAGLCRVLASLDAFDQHTNLPTNQETNQPTKGGRPSLRWSGGIAERYRMMLFTDGEEAFAEDIYSGENPESHIIKQARKGFKRKDVKKVLAKGGKLSFGETIRCKVRYFSDGMAVGRREFVDQVFERSRSRFGEKRTSGARPMRGIAWKTKHQRIYSIRQLINNPLE
jgi:REP element-mobilizing transposase RayT